MRWSVWVDLDNNGDFYGPEELVFRTYGQGKKFGTIRIPSAQNGLSSTRMRVTANYGSDYAGPCGNYTAGETQDFTIVQRALPPCIISQMNGLDFTAYAINPKEVSLKWSNNTGELNEYFAVERSADGNRFEEILREDGQGSAGEILYFAVKDKAPLAGVNHYRVRRVFADKSVEYSEVQTVEMATVPTVVLYPNPALSEVHIFGEHLGNETCQLRLINAFGQIVLHKSVQFDAEESIETLSLDAVPSGLYEVQILSEKYRVISKKLVVEKG